MVIVEVLANVYLPRSHKFSSGARVMRSYLSDLYAVDGRSKMMTIWGNPYDSSSLVTTTDYFKHYRILESHMYIHQRREEWEFNGLDAGG